MKILLISHCFPYPPNKGERYRLYAILQKLAQDHEVSLLCFSRGNIPEESLEKVRSLCSSVKHYQLLRFCSVLQAGIALLCGFPATCGYFFSRAFQRTLQFSIEQQKPDLLFAYCSSVAWYGNSSTGQKKVVDLVDVDSAKWKSYAESPSSSWWKRILYKIESKRLVRLEKTILENYQKIYLSTELEREKLLAQNPQNESKVHVVINGLDTNTLQTRAAFSGNGSSIMLFAGQMDYFPNILSVNFITEKVFPLVKKEIPGVEFRIAGRNPSGRILQRKGVSLVGAVPDMQEELQKADVFVTPMPVFFGSPTKIMEAITAGLPVVTSNNVVSAFGENASQVFLAGESEQEIANHIIRLLKDPKLREQYSKQMQEYARQKFDWEVAFENLHLE